MPDNSVAWMRNDEADERMAHLHDRFLMRRTTVAISALMATVPTIDKLEGEALDRVAECFGYDRHLGPALADRVANADRIREHIAASRVVASDAGALLRWVVR